MPPNLLQSHYVKFFKRELGLCVKQHVNVLSFDYVFQRVFDHHDKLSNDLNLLKESTTCWCFTVADSSIFKTKWIDEISKPLFKYVVQNDRLQTTLQSGGQLAQRTSYFRWISKLFKSMDFKGYQIRLQSLYKASISHRKVSTFSIGKFERKQVRNPMSEKPCNWESSKLSKHLKIFLQRL